MQTSSRILALTGSLAALALAVPAHGDEADAARRAEDRADIQNLVARYVRALDTRDPDLYANVFTEDATFDVAGDVRHGRAEIRAIITGLRQSEAARSEPGPALYHVIVNSEIEIASEARARHHAYWQTIRLDGDGAITIGAMGTYDDRLVKQDGKWLIAERILGNFAQQN